MKCPTFDEGRTWQCLQTPSFFGCNLAPQTAGLSVAFETCRRDDLQTKTRQTLPTCTLAATYLGSMSWKVATYLEIGAASSERFPQGSLVICSFRSSLLYLAVLVSTDLPLLCRFRRRRLPPAVLRCQQTSCSLTRRRKRRAACASGTKPSNRIPAWGRVWQSRRSLGHGHGSLCTFEAATLARTSRADDCEAIPDAMAFWSYTLATLQLAQETASIVAETSIQVMFLDIWRASGLHPGLVSDKSGTKRSFTGGLCRLGSGSIKVVAVESRWFRG